MIRRQGDYGQLQNPLWMETKHDMTIAVSDHRPQNPGSEWGSTKSGKRYREKRAHHDAISDLDSGQNLAVVFAPPLSLSFSFLITACQTVS